MTSLSPPLPGRARSLDEALTAWLAGLALVLPWLNPFSPGPSATVMPWIISAALAAIVLWLLPAARVGLPLAVGGLVFMAALFAFSGGPTHDVLAAAGGMAVILACAAVSGAGRPDGARLLAWAWAAAAVLSSVIALCQYFGVAHHFSPWMSVPSEPEAYSNLRQRNQFASLASLGVAAVVWLAAQHRRWALALPALALLAVAGAASASRTGGVQLLLIMGLFTLWRGPQLRERVILCVWTLGWYAAATLALPPLQQAWAGVEGAGVLQRLATDLGCSSRKVLWRNALELVGQHPWLGWGWGELDYGHYTNLYVGPRFCDILDNAHNLPLHLAVELGVPVAVLLCAGLAWMALRARPWAETDTARQLAWLGASLLLMHSLVEYPLWYGPFQMALGFSLGLLWPPVASVRAVRRDAVLGRALAVAMLGALAYAAWDYDRVSQIYLAPEARRPDYRDDTMAKLQASWLFSHQVRFAELTMAEVTPQNADAIFLLSGDMLHYSPEGRVVEKRLDTALLLGRRDEVREQLARFKAAFPAEHDRWLDQNRAALTAAGIIAAR